MEGMKRFATVWLFFFGSFWGFSQDTEQHPIAPELVGKWCYLNLSNGGNGTLSETCISLNADGTYEFDLDGSGIAKANSFFPGSAVPEKDVGSWWVHGNTLHYNSSIHGDGSLQFEKVNQPNNENVPTIVVSGQYFVCTTLHNPW